ncbi:MAG: hypothetical protein M1839_006779 [Geoglossum umbratile]|nr:MAG: hypothetical protein M1839_006779 [Geoglossum umbratile]
MKQVEAIHTLVYKHRDLILSARTGWGKSMNFQSVPVLRNGGICLMIMPLNALESDQAQSIDKLPCYRSYVLNGETNSPALRQRIRNGEFNHVLTSPEIALGKKLLPVLQDSKFQDRLVLVAIDELHVVDQWGTVWQEEYSQLRELRSRVRRGIPWFGTSATLDPVMLESVKS